MALNGTEKEMRMPPGASWSSETLDHNNNNNNNTSPNHHHHLSEHHHQDLSDRFQVMPISVGSKLKLPTKYRECLKNHAATIGGHVTDGCGEFMPSGEDGTLEALKCAACNCHRNFHRKESTNPYAADTSEFSRTTAVHPLPLPLPAPMPSPSTNRHRNVHNHTPLNMHSNHWAPVPPVKMSFGSGSGAATDSSSEELNFNAGGGAVAPPYGSPKKRFRTKFTQEQKEKMMEFAEKVGWRIPREDDAQVQRFCGEIGVKRQVFKVWMHNNKSTSAVSAPTAPHIVNIDAAATVNAGEIIKDKQIQDSTYGD
ncbi:hypothetical protein AgCh_010298 [Apium graveolens]